MTRFPMRVAVTADGLIEAAWPEWWLHRWWVHVDPRTGNVVASNAPEDAFRLLVRAARQHVAI